MPMRVFILRVCKRLCTGSSFLSSHGWTTSVSILRQSRYLSSLFRSFHKASDQMCCFNVDRFLGRKLHSSVQIYLLSNFFERSALKKRVKLPSKPLEKYLRRIGPASVTGNQLLFDHRLQVLGRFNEAFSGLKNNVWIKWQPLCKVER